MMKQPVQFTYAWNRSYVPTGGAEIVYLLLELKGTGETKFDRVPLNVSLVLDRSGSMSGAPLEYSKKACQFVVGQMNRKDTLSMVAFDDEISTVFKPEQVMNKDLMKKKVASISSGGSTNLSGGLIQGLQYVAKNKRDGQVNRVILLSDGHANVGVTDKDKLAQIAKEYFASGTSVTTMGLGQGFDENLMEAIADLGGGNFYYIEKADDIPTIFNQELQGLLTVVAQNFVLNLKPSDKAKITGVYGYGTEVTEEDGVTLALGDLYQDELKSVLVELTLYPHLEGCHNVVEALWEYVDLDGTPAVKTALMEIGANFTSDIDLINSQLNSYVEQQVLITKSAEAIDQALSAFEEGDIEKGKDLLQQQADTLLLQAIQTNDMTLHKQSQALYDKLDHLDHSAPMMIKELHQQKYRNYKRRNDS